MRPRHHHLQPGFDWAGHVKQSPSWEEVKTGVIQPGDVVIRGGNYGSGVIDFCYDNKLWIGSRVGMLGCPVYRMRPVGERALLGL